MGKVCSYLNYNLYPFLRINKILKINTIQTSTLILNKIIYYNNCQLNLITKKETNRCLIF